MEREAVVWNCSCVNAMKGAVLHRTVPSHRVNRKPIRTYEERFLTEPFQSSRVKAAFATAYTAGVAPGVFPTMGLTYG